MALDHSCQVQRHPLAERGLDLYQTPAVAVKALLRAEQIPHSVLEPCAGRGAVARVLRDHGHAVICNDIVDYGFPLHTVGDFLATTAMPAGCDCILTNPPFNIVEPFVAHVSPTARVATLSVGAHAARKRDHDRADAALIALAGAPR